MNEHDRYFRGFGDPPEPTPGILDAASAQVDVTIRGVVHNICRSVQVDYAALAQKVTAEIKRQAEAINLDKLIATTVTQEMRRTVDTLERNIRDEIKRLVAEQVRSKLGKLPEHVAEAFAGKVWDDWFSSAGKRES